VKTINAATETADITLLIHGPVSIYTLLSLYRYRAEYPIVLVLPKPTTEQSSSLLAEVQSIVNDLHYKISLVVYDPDVVKHYNNTQNRYLHFFSVALGLDLCKTRYTVKLRSDEFYSKLTTFVDIVLQDRRKITTTDVFFRKRSSYPIHPSDHMLGGKTDLLKSIFCLAKEYCEDVSLLKANPFAKSAVVPEHMSGEDKLAPEQVLGVAILAKVSDDQIANAPDDITLMKNTFMIIPSDTLGFFRIAANSLTVKEYFDRSYFDNGSDISNVEDYAP
jgi:hypothetical protein